MKILFVNLAAEWGGGEGWTLRSALGLAARRHDVQIAARSSAPLTKRAQTAGLFCHPVEVGMDYHPGTILDFARITREQAIDVIVVHHNKDVRTAAVAAKLTGCPVVHRNGFPILKNNWRHRITTSFVTRILTNSGRIRDLYQGFGWLKTPIDLVYNGVLPPNGEESGANLRALVPEWPDETLIALYSGRLTTVKRVDVLLRAISSLPESSRWRLVVLGTGSEGESLRQFAHSHDLGSRVHFAGFREDAAALAGKADLVVLASTEEGMPNALMEAMVRGVPVASTPSGDVPQLLADGKAGWLVPFDDPASWSALLRRLETQPEEREQMGRAGQERVSSRFTFNRMIEGIEASLKRAVNKD